MKFIKAVAVTVLLLSAACAYGQSKGETKLYNSVISKGDIKGYNKFLKKYPSSVYAPKITRILDSIDYSAVDKEDISACVKYMAAKPNSAFFQDAEQRVFSLALKGRYIQNDALGEYKVIEEFMPVAIGDNGYYYYTYENFSPSEGDAVEYVVNLIDKRDGAAFAAMFSGKKKKAENFIGYIIEGESMDEETNRTFKTAEMTYLLNMLSNKEFLIPLSKADIMTDQALAWWLKENPARSKKLDFGVLAPESSIVEMYKKQKDFETSGGNKAALFDIRGYTVVVSYQKASNQYVLVWCEPVCKDKKRNQLLNTIYFESTNSLVLYYYKGKSTFKIRVNLANKAVTY